MSTTLSSSGSWDAIVIGSGLGGLSAAAHLAATGQSTLLLERYEVVGGSSHVFRRKRQWEFDVGVHYIGDCGPNGQVPTLLRGLGVDDRVEWLPLAEDGLDTIVGDDLELKVPFGWDNYLENLIKAFPHEERQLKRWHGHMRRMGEQIDRSLTPSSTSEMAKFTMRSGRSAPWIMAPAASLMVACGLSPRTIQALSVQMGALATTSTAGSAGLQAGFLQNFVGGGGYFPKGGGQMLAAAFTEVIQSHGGQIRTHAEVERIIVQHNAVQGVKLATGEVLAARSVVAAGDIQRTYRDLVGYENLPSSLVRRSNRWKMSKPLINAYFGIEIDLSNTPNSNFYVIPNWDDAGSLRNLRRMTQQMMDAKGRNSYDWANDFATRQTTYIQSSTRRDPSNPRSAPAGHAAIEVQTLAPYGPDLWGFDPTSVAKGGYRKESQYQEIKEIITAGMLSRVERIYPGASTKVRWSELATPATQERYTHTTGGNSYGLEPRISQFGPFRPKSATPIKGLFLAGTSTAWGPGTEGSMLSGMHAASAITGRDLQTEVRAGKVIADRSLLPDRAADFDPLAICKRLSKKPTDQVIDESAEELVAAAPVTLG